MSPKYIEVNDFIFGDMMSLSDKELELLVDQPIPANTVANKIIKQCHDDIPYSINSLAKHMRIDTSRLWAAMTGKNRITADMFINLLFALRCARSTNDHYLISIPKIPEMDLANYFWKLYHSGGDTSLVRKTPSVKALLEALEENECEEIG